MKRLVEVLLPIAISHTFTYELPDAIECPDIGTFVKVSFRNRSLYGVIWKNDVVNFNPELKYKKISYIAQYLQSLSHCMIDFIKYVSDYNIAPLGMILKMVIGLNATQLSQIMSDNKDSNYLKNPTSDTCNFQKIQNIQNFQLELNSEQQNVANKIIANSAEYGVSLIHGITGSGKTEVYLWLASQILKLGGQVLVLVPEIVLTTQLMNRFQKHIPANDLLQWHSSLSAAKRRNAWSDVYYGVRNFIVGARSALFLPFKNLKMIIVDEEHDLSFKQEDRVIYHARDMAIVRAKIENIPAILVSATPSIETFFNVQRQKFYYYCLHKRYSGSLLPEIKLLDMRKANTSKKNVQWIHNSSRQAIIDIIRQGKQSLIFINRRGYAPTTFCIKCYNKAECLNCSAQLVYHKAKKKMQCHYCGYEIQYCEKCSKCEEEGCIIPFGPGVEKIAEEVQDFIQGSRILILTSDTINTPNRAREAIRKIVNHEVDIIIGTQMITKGLHFPDLKLVIVVDADPNVLGCNIRSLEHTYQMLHQVIGRAGREKERGIVLIQTTDPESHLLHSIVVNDMLEFMKTELQQRKEAFVPPFSRLVSINLASYDERTLINFAHRMIKLTPMQSKNFAALGPTPAPIYLLNKKFRYRIMIRTPRNINVQKIVRDLIAKCNAPSSVTIRADVDPYSFM